MKKQIEFNSWSELYEKKLNSYLDITLEDYYKEEYRKKLLDERINEKDFYFSCLMIEDLIQKVEKFDNKYFNNDFINEEKYENIKEYVEYY